MRTYPADPLPSPPPLPAAGRASMSPPPLPRAVLPIYEPFLPPPASPASGVIGIIAFVLAVVYLLGMLVLNSARARPAGGPPTSNDLLLACGVFPLALIGGMVLLFFSVIAIVCTPGRARILAVLAV